MGVKIHLYGDGLEYETEASLIQAAKIIGFLNTEEPLTTEYDQGQSRISKAENNFIDEGSVRPLSSPREAVLDSGAKTNAQKILILGQYIADRDGTDEFAPAELKTLFVKAGEAAPRNLARDIRDAIRAGYITESIETTGVYVVTNTGRKAIAEGFQNNGAVSGNRRRSASSSRHSVTKASKAVPDWISSLSISDQMEGFPSYRKMSIRSYKVLWILQWATTLGREQITGAEIEAVASKLADNVPSKQVASSVRPFLSKSYISKNSEGYRILHNGSEHLKESDSDSE